jgi:hypothetical protein
MQYKMKIVSLPISVPDSGFCWDGHTPCENFNNQYGFAECTLGVGDLVRDPVTNIYPKPLECLELFEL